MTQKIGPCKLCSQIKPLVKSHIIPKFFYENDNFLLSDKLPHRKKSPIGGYDAAILCSDCEAYLAEEYDNDAKIILLDKPPNKVELIEINNPENANESRVFYRLKNQKERDIIDRFVISVLWRASVSSIEEFKNIRLGCYEALAKKTILDKSFNFADIFTVTLFELSDLKTRITIVSKRTHVKGVSFYILTMGSIKAYIKCDKQKHPFIVYPEILMYKSTLQENPKEHDILKKYCNFI